MIPGFVWQVPASVVRVHDGDTVMLVLDLGWRIYHGSADPRCKPISVRLLGVSADELGTPTGDAAAAFVRDLLPTATVVTVQSKKLDLYGRTLGDILLPDGRSLIAVLKEAGHVH